MRDLNPRSHSCDPDMAEASNAQMMFPTRVRVCKGLALCSDFRRVSASCALATAQIGLLVHTMTLLNPTQIDCDGEASRIAWITDAMLKRRIRSQVKQLSDDTASSGADGPGDDPITVPDFVQWLEWILYQRCADWTEPRLTRSIVAVKHVSELMGDDFLDVRIG